MKHHAQMWFAALGSPNNNPWIIALMERILRGNSETLRLLPPLPEPFDSSHPPKFIRARLFVYDFAPQGWVLDSQLNVFRGNLANATQESKMWDIGSVWKRKFVREYIPSISLENESLQIFLKQLDLQHNDEMNHESGKATLFVWAYASAGILVSVLLIAENMCTSVHAWLSSCYTKRKSD